MKRSQRPQLLRASTLPKREDIPSKLPCRGWQILHELMAGLKDETRSKRQAQSMHSIIQQFQANGPLLKQKKQPPKVPSVQQLIKRVQYVQKYRKLRNEMINQRINAGLEKMKAAGIELRNTILKELGINATISESEVSQYSRIEPHLRTLSERQYLLYWIESKIPKDGIIDNLFRRCDFDKKMAFVAGLKYRHYPSSSAMVWQNDIAQEFFILISGKVGVYVNNVFSNKDNNDRADYDTKGNCVATINTGFSFGEAALKGGDSTRAATIIAEEDSEVLIASRELFEDIVKQFNESNKAMVVGLLSNVWPFKGLRQEVLDKMGTCFDLVNLNADVEVFTQGKAAENIYVIIEGGCKEILYFHSKKNKSNEQNGFKKPPLPRQNGAICHSSGIVVSQFDGKRLLGAFEILKHEFCATSIVTSGIVQGLKAQLAKFFYHIQSCPVLRRRITRSAKLHRMLVDQRKEQYFASRGNQDLKMSISFAMENRSYVHTPRSFLNKVKKKRQALTKSNETKAEFEDMLQKQERNYESYNERELYEIHLKKVAENELKYYTKERKVLSDLMQEKLKIDLKRLEKVDEKIEEYSARYKEKAISARLNDIGNHKGKNKRKRSQTMKMKQNSIIMETLKLKQYREKWKYFEGRFVRSCVDTDKTMQRSDDKRSDYRKLKYDGVNGMGCLRMKNGNDRRSKLDFYAGKGTPMIAHKKRLLPRDQYLMELKRHKIQ